MLPTSPLTQPPQIPAAPSSTPKIKLSQLTENLILNTGNAPADSDIQACSELPLDLEKLKTIIDLLMQDNELLSFLRYPHTSKSLSGPNGIANFGVKCEDAPDNVRELFLVYYGKQNGRPVLLKEMLISVSQLISCKVQREHNCLAGKDLCGMNLSGIPIYRGNLCKTNLRKVNMSNSTLGYINLKEADLRGCSFENAVMNEVRIEGAQIDENTNFTNAKITLSFPKQLTPLKLYRLLATINRINDDYQALKIGLVHQIIARLKSEFFADVQQVFSSLINFLEKPIYLQDKKITSFIAEMFFKLNTSPQQLTAFELYRFLFTINMVNDDHKALKIKWVHQIIDLLKRVADERISDVQKVFSNLTHLLKTPIYLEEEKITSFVAERFFNREASPRRLTPLTLCRFLKTINRIHDAYQVLKIKLVHQIIDSLKIGTDNRFSDVPKVFSTLVKLLKNPIYLQDNKITSFITEKFLNMEGSIPELDDLLRFLKVIKNTDQKTQQEIISKSTGFVIRLMVLCSELGEDGKNQIGLPMLYQLIDFLNDAEISGSDNKLVTILLNHPVYIDDRRIMRFMASQLIKSENFPRPGLDSLFFGKIVDCLRQEKFTRDSAPLIQLMALYAQACREIAPELSVNILFHAIEMFHVDNFSNCRNVLWDTLLTSPIYLQDSGIFKLIRSKFIHTKMVVPATSGGQSETELKLQFLLNVIHGLTPEDLKKFMLNNNHFFIRFVEWCSKKETPPKIIRQVEMLYAAYLALPELNEAAGVITEHNPKVLS